MALYFSVRGGAGAALVANLKGTLDTEWAYFMLMTWPPYIYERTSELIYTNQAMGWVSIPPGSFVLSGNKLVYTPTGGLAITVNYSGRINWFLLEVPSGSKNVIYWPGSGTQLTAGQQYVITSIEIPLAAS